MRTHICTASQPWGLRTAASVLCLCALLAGAAQAQPLAPTAEPPSAPAQPASAAGQPPTLPSAPADLIEAGVPSFTVLGAEALGLSSPPTDIHILPDGRTLIVAANELAIGDGVRWETFQRQAFTDTQALNQVAVDRDGTIYASTTGHFARIEFAPDGHWRLAEVAPFPPELPEAAHALSQVSEAAGEWYWNAGGGVLVAWHPGRAAKVIGRLNDYERVVAAGGKVFVSDPSIGAIYRIEAESLVAFDKPEDRNEGRAIVSDVSLPGGLTLVGTGNLGALVFDGTTLKPWAQHGLLAGRFRIANLCPAGAGYYCATLDNVGLVFFDSQGRVVQVLDRSVDNRFNRVRRLLQAPGGGVWVLLNGGIAQVEFPARISHFESRVTSGLTYAQLCRYEGRLWLQADGLIQRGIYDEEGYLLRFEPDATAPRVYSAASVGGRFVLATSHGIYQRVADSWKQVTQEPRNALVVADEGNPDRWLYVTEGEVGWVRFTAKGPVTERFPVPGLGYAFNRILQNGNVFWAELGATRAARIQAGPDDRLTVRLIGADEGLPDGWTQTFLVDGVVRFNIAGAILRYEEATGRIVPDPAFLKTAPQLLGGGGRPMRDARGRLWLTTDEGVRVLDERIDPTRALWMGRMPPSFIPIRFIMEDQGVVWMQRRHRLVRFDPSIPELQAPPLQAIISHVHLTGSNRHWVSGVKELPLLGYRDNSLTAQFLSPNAVFGLPVAFEVLLEGAGGTWAPTGAAGAASFTGLKEGHYVLHVRPRSGEVIGAEATLAFTIRPPWFRTPLAYIAYLLGAAALVFGVARTWSHIARLEKARLARLVAERTGELRRSEERYRRLNEDLEKRVQSRTAELESFSYSVSHDLRAPLRTICGFTDLLQKRLDPQLEPETRHFLEVVSAESIRLGQLIDSLLAFSRLGRAELTHRRCDLAKLVEAVRQELQPTQEGRAVEWRIGALPTIEGDPTLLRQVFANLLGNALKFSRQRQPAIIEIGELPAPPAAAGSAPAPAEHVLFVRDNGAGFNPQYADKLFGVFQRLHSAREFEGTGIGLANVHRIVARHHGRVWATGEPDKGATFFVALPATRPAA